MYPVGIEHPRITKDTPGGKIIVSWPVKRLTDCDHPVTLREVCYEGSCTQACGKPCKSHQHCEKCGATRCHGYWWRSRSRGVFETSLVDRR